MSHTPIRSCVICRQRFPKKELARHIVREEACEQLCKWGENISDQVSVAKTVYAKTLCYDERSVFPGRGHYVCARESCREKFASYTGSLKKRRKKRGK